MSGSEAGYSEIANEQLDELESGADAQLSNDILDTCELILANPAAAQARSGAIQTLEGIRFRTPVQGHGAYKVFWSPDGPRIEAVFRNT